MSSKTKKDDKAQGPESPLVYVGEDRGFWESFLKDLKATYKQLKFDNETYFETNPVKLQNLIVKLIADRPKAIFFDLSKFPDEILHIARVIIRTNAIIKPHLFGLVDITTDKKYINIGVMAGLPSIHVKTSETESLIYDLICTCFTGTLEEHGFAIAKLNDTVSAFMPAKIGMMNKSSILVESNFPIKQSETYFLHTYWSKNKTLVSPLVRAQNQITTGLYYEYDYSQELKIVFSPNVADVTPESDDLSNDEYAKKTKELQEKGAESQKKFNAWVDSNLGNSKPKNIKVLVIDKVQTFFIDQPKTDEFDFVLRCQPYLKFPKKEIIRLGPQLIIFHMEQVPIEELEANEDITYTYNETRTLQYIIKSIKSIEGYEPYIIVFNNLGHDTKKLQEALVYPNIVSYKEALTPSLVVKMANLLQSKLNLDNDMPGTIVLNKDLQQTFAEFEFSIQLLACSETDIYFSTDMELRDGMLIRVTSPTDMYITVVPPPKNPKASGYYGLINGLGEDGRMHLRKFINSVFFRSLEEQKAAEKEEIEKIKEEAIKKKKEEEEEAIRLKKEEEENKKKEAEAKKQEEEERKALMKKQAETAEMEKKMDANANDKPE